PDSSIGPAMFPASARHRYPAVLSWLLLMAIGGSFTALAQDDEVPAAPAQMPDAVPAPALKWRFGVAVNNYIYGNVRGAIVVGVYPNSPATRVRVKRTRQDGSVVYGEPTTMIRGDIITRLVETETDDSRTIR